MNPARSVGRSGNVAASATTAAARPFGIARRVVIDSLIGASATPPLGKVPVEEANEGTLLRRMRVCAGGRTIVRRQANRLAIVDVARHDERMHVRLATDRRRVSQLGGDEPHLG